MKIIHNTHNARRSVIQFLLSSSLLMGCSQVGGPLGMMPGSSNQEQKGLISNSRGGMLSISLEAVQLELETATLEEMQRTVEQGGNCKIKKEFEEKSLVLAAWKGDFDTVKSLVEQGINKNATNSDGRTGLMLAARSGHINIVQYLVDQKADFKYEDQWGYTALIFAAGEGKSSIVSYLIEQGASTETTYKDEDRGTALILAAQNGHLSVVKCLVEGNANMEAKNKYEETALRVAARSKYKDIVSYLVNKKRGH